MLVGLDLILLPALNIINNNLLPGFNFIFDKIKTVKLIFLSTINFQTKRYIYLDICDFISRAQILKFKTISPIFIDFIR